MLTQDELKALLHYDSDTGVFTRLVRTSNAINVGDIAGTTDAKGYVIIRVKGVTHKAHRLAWLYVHGVWPSGEVDHINHDPSDNRISNLRDVSKSANQQNRRAPRGYSRDGNRWKAQIRVCGKWQHLGCFATESEAHAAYLSAKSQLHQKARAE